MPYFLSAGPLVVWSSLPLLITVDFLGLPFGRLANEGYSFVFEHVFYIGGSDWSMCHFFLGHVSSVTRLHPSQSQATAAFSQPTISGSAAHGGRKVTWRKKSPEEDYTVHFFFKKSIRTKRTPLKLVEWSWKIMSRCDLRLWFNPVHWFGHEELFNSSVPWKVSCYVRMEVRVMRKLNIDKGLLAHYLAILATDHN